jgi:hypothetical protein
MSLGRVIEPRRASRRRLLRGAGVAFAVLLVVGWYAPPAASSPQSRLTPLLTCVDVNGDGSVTAHFGYSNSWTNTVNIPAGKPPPGQQNWFLPDPTDRGQLSKFDPGTYQDAFTVTFTEPSIEWRLGDVNGAYNAVTASASDTRCASVPAFGVDSPWPVAVIAVALGVALVARRRHRVEVAT